MQNRRVSPRRLSSLALAALPALAIGGCGDGGRTGGFSEEDAGGGGGGGAFSDARAGGPEDGLDAGPSCDGDLPVFGDASAFARAIGICRGLVAASFTRGHASSEPPADGQHGVLPAFGKVVVPREGARLGVLSTGWARAFDDVSATSCDPASLVHCFKQGVAMQNGLPVPGATPSGHPAPAPGCATSDQVFDPISVKLEVEVPEGAGGFALDFDFFSGEWPDYVCTKYNDGFLLLVDGVNVALDAAGRTLSVNNAFFDRCTVGTQTGCRGDPPIFGTSTCGGDLAELEGTGFYAPGLYCNGQPSTGGGATGWLTTQAPVQAGGKLRMELLIWDTGDPKFDSTVLVDHFRWVPEASAPSTTRLR